MTRDKMLELISEGRTDLVFELIKLPDWRKIVQAGPINPLAWFIYYGDVTALRAVVDAGHDLTGLNLNEQLNSAAFFGYWKICDFLIAHGADPKHSLPGTGETALHNALCKAERPYFGYTVQLLLERGADPNARTIAGQETSAFMRDTRTKGETPLHRAAAFSDPPTIQLLLDYGAEKQARDANGDSPLTWASWHLRPGSVLQLLAFPPHNISDKHVATNTSDHGSGWGNGMERSLMGEYRPLKY